MADNPSRELILRRIRAGLSVPMPGPAPAAENVVIFPPVTNPLERFQQECKANLMELTLTADAQASVQVLATILGSLPDGEIYVQDAPALRRMIEVCGPKRTVRWASESAPREASQATLSLAEALVAQTGSIFVSASCGGRGISAVAPCHIVFATTDQLVPDLKTALSNAFKKGTLQANSFACMISGSSRTADIEKILVQGAHGPRRLSVILQSS